MKMDIWQPLSHFASFDRISQFDSSKQRLYYGYPKTGQVTWAHPSGEAADAQEVARFYQIQELQQQRYGQHVQSGQGYSQRYADSYNRMGGMGPGAGLAMGALAGKLRPLFASCSLLRPLSHLKK